MDELKIKELELKYNNEAIVLRNRLRACFYSFVIKDPYPEIAEYDLFHKIKTMIKPDISAHKAWQDGFNFAKNLVLKELDLKDEKPILNPSDT
jgi:hypothetical protein